MRQLHLKNKRYQVESLPSETTLLVELISLCHDDTATFEMFSSAISKDPGLTAKILGIAKAPTFRQWKEVTGLRQVLIIIGMRNVKQIVIASAIKQFFSSFSLDFDAHVQAVWLRALICSNLIRVISSYIGYTKPEEACLTGLLYQVGQLVFLLNHQTEYSKLMLQCDTTDDLFRREQESFGIDHCELGAALLERWQMDSFWVDAVRFQHAPISELQNATLLKKTLSVASCLTSMKGQIPTRSSLDRAGQLFNMTEATALNCFAEALAQTKEMVVASGHDWNALMAQHAGDQAGSSAGLQQAASSLAEQVKAIALTRGSFTSDEKDLTVLLTGLRTAFSTLFNLDTLIFLQPDPANQCLRPFDDLTLNFPEETNLLYQDRDSLIAKSFREHQKQKIHIHCSSMIDKHFLRALKTEQAYAFPIPSGYETAGLLILGLTAEDVDFVEKNLVFVEMLIREFAHSYQRIMAEQNQAPGFTYDEFREIAHEVISPLSVIKNYLYLLGNKLQQEPAAQEQIRFIKEEIERIGDILLRTKNTQEQPSMTTNQTLLNINNIIRDLNDVLCASHFRIREIESSLQLDDSIPALQGSPDQFKQILLNLIKNAVEAMEAGGQIVIATRDHFYLNGQEFVEISIKDDGPGIPEQVLQHLFSPVVSTKQGHSGLGLSIVKNLVAASGGEIFCDSDAQTGTEFKVLVPRKLPTVQSQ